ncbi:MAG: CDP-alcohol phosphatidyltransferase family protein [Nitrospiria bacterium]
MNIPNRLTFIRLILAYIGFTAMMLDHWVTTFFLILTSVLLDAVDGKVARHLMQVSKSGIFLDVMVDKVVIISTFLLIGYKFDPRFFYLGLLMILREYTMDTMRSIAASQQKIISADFFSKLKGVILMIAMVGAIGNRAFFRNIQLELAMVSIGAVGMTLSYMTLGRFYLKYKALLIS